MKNDPRNVVAEELNLDRIRASCPHAVTLRDDIEDIWVEETDYGNIYIFWGTFFLSPFQKFIM